MFNAIFNLIWLYMYMTVSFNSWKKNKSWEWTRNIQLATDNYLSWDSNPEPQWRGARSFKARRLNHLATEDPLQNKYKRTIFVDLYVCIRNLQQEYELMNQFNFHYISPDCKTGRESARVGRQRKCEGRQSKKCWDGIDTDKNRPVCGQRLVQSRLVEHLYIFSSIRLIILHIH